MTKTCGSLLGAMLAAMTPLFCACSSGSGASNPPGNTSHDAGGDAAGQGPTEGGAHPGDGGVGLEAAPAGSKFAGSVFATQSIGATTTSSTLVADFFAGVVPPASCSAANQVMMGACCYTPPPMASDAGLPEAGPMADAGMVTLPNAGVITVTDGTVTAGTLTPNGPSGTYPADTTPTAWMPGDTLSIAAAGATVDAFMGSVQAVSPLAGVTPALSVTMLATIPESADFVLSWTADTKTTGAKVSLTLVAGSSFVQCNVTEGGGAATLTVPAAILGMLPKGTAVLELGRSLSSTVTNGNATILLASSTSATGLGMLQ